MQFTIDTAQRNYVLRTNLINKKKEEKSSVSENISREVTLLDKSAAFLAGAAISGIVSNLKRINSEFFLTALQKTAVLPSFEETAQAVEKMNLNNKTTRVLFVEDNPDDMKKISEIIAKNSLAGVKKFFHIGEKSLLAKAVKLHSDGDAAFIAKGKKATFFVNEKIAIINKKMHQGIFHEIGHAKVANNKMLKPLLTVGKKIQLVAAFSGFCALEHTPRAHDPNNPKTLWEKTQDYMDRNIGKITFATFIPLFVEKYIASKEGLKEAKIHLDKPKVNSLKKLYRVGLVTYLASAFSAAAGIGLGNKVQNNIIKQKQSPQDVYNLLI